MTDEGTSGMEPKTPAKATEPAAAETLEGGEAATAGPESPESVVTPSAPPPVPEPLAHEESDLLAVTNAARERVSFRHWHAETFGWLGRWPVLVRVPLVGLTWLLFGYIWIPATWLLGYGSMRWARRARMLCRAAGPIAFLLVAAAQRPKPDAGLSTPWATTDNLIQPFAVGSGPANSVPGPSAVPSRKAHLGRVLKAKPLPKLGGDAKGLQGVWKVRRIVLNPKYNGTVLREFKFRGYEALMLLNLPKLPYKLEEVPQMKDFHLRNAEVTLEPRRRPGRITFRSKDSKITIRAVYRLRGDELTLVGTHGTTVTDRYLDGGYPRAMSSEKQVEKELAVRHRKLFLVVCKRDPPGGKAVLHGISQRPAPTGRRK